jgi:hypothetical protein
MKQRMPEMLGTKEGKCTVAAMGTHGEGSHISPFVSQLALACNL